MRKLILFFLVLVNNVYSQTDFIQSVINLNGNVKSRIVEECLVSYKFGNIVKDDCYSGVDLFDDQGKILEVFGRMEIFFECPSSMDVDSGITFRLTYDNLNNISSVSLGRYAKGVYDISQFIKYTRDDSERLLREEFFNADGFLTEVVNYEYDKSNNLISRKSTEFDLMKDDFGKVKTLDSHSYGVSADGKNYHISKEMIFGDYYTAVYYDTTFYWHTLTGTVDSLIHWPGADLEKGDEYYVYINHYDKGGILNLEVYRGYLNGGLIEEGETVYTYYENGYPKKQESSKVLIEYDYVFDDMGNPVEVVEKRNGKPWLITTYTYEYEE